MLPIQAICSSESLRAACLLLFGYVSLPEYISTNLDYKRRASPPSSQLPSSKHQQLPTDKDLSTSNNHPLS
jgi:hypothetical protein